MFKLAKKNYHVFSCRWTLNFIKSNFKGQLPAHYLPDSEATKIVRSDMNDLNREEFSRYVSTATNLPKNASHIHISIISQVKIETCDYLIDLDSVSPTELEPVYSRHRNWTSIYSVPFLDASRYSSTINRAIHLFYEINEVFLFLQNSTIRSFVLHSDSMGEAEQFSQLSFTETQ